MKELKCSRCHKKEFVEESYNFKECGKCHARTEKRYPVIRQHEPRDFNVSTLFSFPSFESFLALELSVHKQRLSKDAKEELRKEWERRKGEWERDNSKRSAQLDSLFAIKQYPLRCQECLKIRIETRKYVENKDSTDIFFILNHCGKCPSCNDFFDALRHGFLEPELPIDPKQEEELRKEGFCSRKKFDESAKEFEEVFRKKDGD